MNNYRKNINYLIQQQSGSDFSDLSADFRNHPDLEDLVKLSTRFKISIDRLVLADLEAKGGFPKNKIKLIVLDVDGVMTDGGMYYTESGDEFKKFNTKDGMGIKERSKNGVAFGIISSGINANLIQRRAELLGVPHVYVGKDKKLPILTQWCKDLNISLDGVAYVGDDINDLEVMAAVGFTACPSDAMDQIKQKVDYILRKRGGEGCVREFLDEFFPQ